MDSIRLAEQARAVTLCGVKAKVLTEAGILEVCCTLEAHKDKKHYDGVFSVEWRSA